MLFAESDRSLVRLLDALAHQPPDLPVLLALQQSVRALADHYEHQKVDVRLRHQIILATPRFAPVSANVTRDGKPR